MNPEQLKVIRKEIGKLIALQKRYGGARVAIKWLRRRADKIKRQEQFVTDLVLDAFDQRSPILHRALEHCAVMAYEVKAGGCADWRLKSILEESGRAIKESARR